MVSPREVAILTKPFQEIIGKDLFADAVALAAQVFDVLVANGGLLHPGQEGLHPGVDAVPGLMAAIVGIAAEEVVKLHIHLVQAGSEVELGHGQLVLIRKENAFGYGTASIMHGSPQTRLTMRSDWIHLQGNLPQIHTDGKQMGHG